VDQAVGEASRGAAGHVQGKIVPVAASDAAAFTAARQI
jgi:hypothetical protein